MTSPDSSEDALLAELGPALARWLAPYVLDELDARERPQGLPSYDQDTCATYVGGLGDPVLGRARLFFHELALAGERGLESRELALLLNQRSPRMIASLLTNSLKKRAKALHLPLPWTAQRTPERRIRWRDREGIAARMSQALEVELESRAIFDHNRFMGDWT
jgi:hypothetical protein